MGLSGLEPPTSRLSGERSNHLSYRPSIVSLLYKPSICVNTHRDLFVFTLKSKNKLSVSYKEVIQPQVPLGLPCYDFTPVADPTVAACPPKVSAASSGRTNSHGVTGGVYKARERIHRGMLIRDY